MCLSDSSDTALSMWTEEESLEVWPWAFHCLGPEMIGSPFRARRVGWISWLLPDGRGMRSSVLSVLRGEESLIAQDPSSTSIYHSEFPTGQADIIEGGYP